MADKKKNEQIQITWVVHSNTADTYTVAYTSGRILTYNRVTVPTTIVRFMMENEPTSYHGFDADFYESPKIMIMHR